MKISEFLGYKRDAAFCEEVVRMTSIENMKKLEQERLLEFNAMYWRKGEEGFVQEGMHAFRQLKRTDLLLPILREMLVNLLFMWDLTSLSSLYRPYYDG